MERIAKVPLEMIRSACMIYSVRVKRMAWIVPMFVLFMIMMSACGVAEGGSVSVELAAVDVSETGIDRILENEAGSYEEVQPASTLEPTPMVSETQPALLAEEVSEYATICELPHEWTIKELGEIIVAAGLFWEEWWNLTGRFSSYISLGSWEDSPFDIYVELLPTSGFESLNDIRDYLLQYYTEAWVDSMLSSEFSPFVEYNDTLFVHDTRAGLSRANWRTSINTLLERDGNRILVQTSALDSAWHRFPNLHWNGDREAFLRDAQEQIIRGDAYINPNILLEDAIGEVWYHVTFIDGRIESVINLHNNHEWNIFE